MNSNIQMYKIYSLTQLSIKQLLIQDISQHISQLHVSAFLKAQPEDGAIETSRNM